MKEVVINYNKNRMLVGLLICFIFVGVGIFIFDHTLAEVVRYVDLISQEQIEHSILVTVFASFLWLILFIVSISGMLFFFIAAIVIIRRSKDSTPFLIINDKGIVENLRKSKQSILRWSDMKNITLKGKQIVIELNHDSEYMEKQTSWIKSILKYDNRYSKNHFLRYQFFHADISVYEAYEILTNFYRISRQSC